MCASFTRRVRACTRRHTHTSGPACYVFDAVATCGCVCVCVIRTQRRESVHKLPPIKSHRARARSYLNCLCARRGVSAVRRRHMLARILCVVVLVCECVGGQAKSVRLPQAMQASCG